jgi:hypothetical protein
MVLLLVQLAAGCGPHRAPGPEPESKPLFEKMPAEVRQSMFPMSEIDIATEICRIRSDGTDAPEILRPYVPPGRRVEGWICQLKRAVPKKLEASGPSDVEFSSFHEFALLFPEPVVGFEVWIEGNNYDPRSRCNSVPNDVFVHIKEGDWIRVSGVFRDDSRIGWEYMKSPRGLLPAGQVAFLSLGHIAVSSLETVTR